MQLGNIGTCEVMKDKEMEDRPHHRDDQCAFEGEMQGKNSWRGMVVWIGFV
jgi:hypothetical protein